MGVNIDPDYRNAALAGRPRWQDTVPGAHALAWQQAQVDQWVADVFGYHALQLGMPELQALRHNRMPHRWLLSPSDATEVGVAQAPAPAADLEGSSTALRSPVVQVCAEFHALPFASNSLDLVVMPHTLEAAADAHQTLREAERVLRPEGKLLITGFNPASLWGLSRSARRARWSGGASASPDDARTSAATDPSPDAADWVGYWRLRDWLRLLSFEVEGGRFGCYAPPVRSQAWMDRLRWMEPLGDRWWPVLGGVYAVMATKRVRGMRLVGLARAAKGVKTPARAVVTQRHQRAQGSGPQGGA